jgi:hypothetical protein
VFRLTPAPLLALAAMSTAGWAIAVHHGSAMARRREKTRR